jgi:hypothetical protein
MPELGTYGSARGVLSNEHSYRNLAPSSVETAVSARRTTRSHAWKSTAARSQCGHQETFVAVLATTFERRLPTDQRTFTSGGRDLANHDWLRGSVERFLAASQGLFPFDSTSSYRSPLNARMVESF